MALVGEAHIIVRAITKDVAGDISSALRGVEGVASSAGAKVGKKFASSFRKADGSMFDKLKAGMSSVATEAEHARAAWAKLQKTGFLLQTAAGALAGSLGSLVGSLGSLAGALGATAASGAALLGALVSLKIGAAVARFALSGVAAAVQKLTSAQGASAAAEKARQYAIIDAIKAQEKTTLDSQKRLEASTKAVAKAQEALNKAIIDGQEALQQLSFDAEEAAIDEKKALLNLEDAKTAYARTLDLPPNNRARKEAEIALAEAELGYRRAVDTNKDLAAEQRRIANENQGRTDQQIAAEQDLIDAKNDLLDTIKENADAEAEAAEQVRRAKEKAADQGAAADPLAGLTESQKSFAKFLAEMQPKLQELKEAAASGFLPILQEQIIRLDKTYFPILKAGLKDVGVALGDAVTSIADELEKKANVESVKDIFATTSQVIRDFGVIGGKTLGSILTILDGAGPLTERFTGYLATQATAFDDWIKTKEASGELQKFFDDAGQLASGFEPVIKNVFSGFSAIIQDALKPGSGAYMLIEWLGEATEGFANLGADKEGLREFLQGATGNTTAMFSSIGALIKEIITLGAMPEIGAFWDKLKEGAPYVGDILKNGILVAPVLADLVVNITKIVAAFADSGAPKAFFDTLNTLAGTLADILNNEVVKGILDAVGPITGFLLALGTIGKIAMDVGKVLVGIFGPKSGFGKALGWLTGAVEEAGMFFANMAGKTGLLGVLGRVGTFLTGPWGIAITAAVGALTYFFTQTEVGKEMWANFTKFLGEAWENIMKFFTDTFNGFVEFFKPLIDPFVAVFTVAFDIMRASFEIFSALLITGFVVMFNAINDTIKQISEWWDKHISKPISQAWDGMIGGIKGAWNGFVKVIEPGIKGIAKVFKDIFTPIINWFKSVIINPLIKLVEGFVNMFIDGLNLMIGKINLIKVPIAAPLRGLFGGAKSLGFDIKPVQKIRLTPLADGGTVKATPGGVYAQIAEAGRNERVEPLDSSGLSQRDRAMIELLAKREEPAVASAPVTINVYPSEGMDERELAATVSRMLALQMRKGAVR